MNGQGWIGSPEAVLNYLRVVQADRNEAGEFLLTGPEGRGPASFMGMGKEIVIPAEVCYMVDGRKVPLAANMPASQGL